MILRGLHVYVHLHVPVRGINITSTRICTPMYVRAYICVHIWYTKSRISRGVRINPLVDSFQLHCASYTSYAGISYGRAKVICYDKS